MQRINVTSSGVTTVGITGKRLDPDEVTLIVDGTEWRGWQEVRVTRGIERCPNDFEIGVTELYPADADRINILPGQACEVWFGKDRVVTGYVNRYSASLNRSQHSVKIIGRGMCQDLVDCAAKWPGQQIIASSVLEVARMLAAPVGVVVNGDPGPAVGQKGSIIPRITLMLGQTIWSVIEELCRTAGLLAFEQPDGSLLLTADPGDTGARALRSYLAGGRYVLATAGFEEGVNVEAATMVFSDDQRYARYEAYRMAFWTLNDLSSEGNFIGAAMDAGARSTKEDPSDEEGRTHVLIVERGGELGVENTRQRAIWERNRRWGRSHMVTLTTDSWRDSGGRLYEPNVLVGLDLPSMKVKGEDWLIGEVTYRKDASGTHCDLLLMPPDAFSLKPTLPSNIVRGDLLKAAGQVP